MRVEVTVEAPDGAPRDVAVSGDARTPAREVGAALMRVMQVEPSTPLHVDGMPFDIGRAWTTQLRTGSVVRPSGGSAHVAATARLVVEAGLDAGRSFDLATRTAHIGRGEDCEIALCDPEVSRCHAVIAHDGRAFLVTDHSSTNGTWVDGTRIDAPTAVRPDNLLRLGNTVLRFESAATQRLAPSRQSALVRPAEPAPRPRTPVPVAACVASAGAALAVGALAHSMQFMMLSLMSPLVLLPAALGGRLRDLRLDRRARKAYRAELDAFRSTVDNALRDEALERRRRHPDPAALVELVVPPQDSAAGADWPVRVGLADQPSELRVSTAGASVPAGTVLLVPAVVQLRPGVFRIGGAASEATRLARWIVMQSCARFTDRQLEICLILDEARDTEWHWARWLPQLAGTAPARSVTPDGRSSGPLQRLVVVDVPGAAVSDTALAQAYPGAAVIVVGHGSAPGARIEVSPGGCLELTTEDGTRLAAVADGVDVGLVEQHARALAHRSARADGRRSDVTLLGLVDADAESVRLRWQETDSGARSAIGTDGGGRVDIDLCADGPHALVVGTTGAGKSELLRTWIAGLALTYPPDELSFVLIDYKGGAAFGRCAGLAHVASVVTDLDRAGAARALRSLHAELRRRETIFARCGATSLDEYRSIARGRGVGRLVLMIDEFAALAHEHAEFLDGLIGVAQRGRSLGVHLVLATQRAGGAISADIRANAALRFVLRVAEANDSSDLLGVPDAARLAPSDRGAAIALTADGLRRIQIAHVSAPESAAHAVTVTPLGPWRVADAPVPVATRTELDAVVDVVGRVAADTRRRPPAPPWLPPLPEVVELREFGPTSAPVIAFGIVDLPDEQRQEAAALDLGVGAAVLFTGPPRSGRTTALASLALSAASGMSAMDLVLYVVDAAGGALAGRLSGLAHIGTSTTLDSTELIGTLAARLLDEVQRRRADDAVAPGHGRPYPRVLVLVDGHDELTRQLDALDNGRTMSALARVIEHGPSVGVSVAVTSSADDHLRARRVYSETYALAPDDVQAATRHKPGQFPDMPPGRCLRGSDGATVQLALAPATATGVAGGQVTPDRITIRPLPTQVLVESLRPAEREFVLGVGGDDARPVELDLIRTRSQLLVAGPPSSGKSLTLASLLQQCLSAGTRVCVAAHDRSPLAAAARARGLPVLAPWETWPAIDCAGGMLLVDDIERFVDQAAGDAITSAVCAPDRRYAVVAGGDATDLSVLHRAAIAQLRRGRTGLLLQPRAVDGELLGIRLARSAPALHPGRGVLVAGPDELGPAAARAGPMTVQVAIPRTG